MPGHKDIKLTKSIRMLLDNAEILPAVKQKPQQNKRGPKAGSGSRTARLIIRCKPELLEVLRELQTNGWASLELSAADIIHLQVKYLAKRDLPDCNSEEMHRKIDLLDSGIPALIDRVKL